MAKNTNNKPPAIVIKLDSITGLQTARKLAKYGIPIYGLVDDPNYFSCETNSCKEILTTNTSSEELIDALIKLGRNLNTKPVLFPCSDECVRLISVNEKKMKELFEFVLPNYSMIELFMNKLNFYRYAQNNGFPIPPTYFPKKKSDLEIITEEIEFPFIIKPALRTSKWFEYFKNKVVKINNSEELYNVFDKCQEATEIPILQQWIKGRDRNIHSCICYFDKNNKPLVTFTSRKLRQWYTENGDACLGEECRNDTVLGETLKLFNSINFKGIGSLEMKMDDISGRYFIIEPNIGRPVTRIGLVESAGLEILYTMYCDALGMTIPANIKQKYTDAKWISIKRDIKSSWTYYKNGQLSIKDWLKSIYGVNSFAVLSLRDPMPFIIDIIDELKYKFKRLLGS